MSRELGPEPADPNKVETDFPGTAAAIPWNDGTGWVVHLPYLPRQPVRHGTGYAHFHDFALLHHTDPARLTGDLRALLQFLTFHADALQADRDLARAADVFLGNCLNLIYDLTWTSSPDLSVGGDHHDITVEGTALLLALHPEHHDLLLTQLQQLEVTPASTGDPDQSADTASHPPSSSPSTASSDATSRQAESH